MHKTNGSNTNAKAKATADQLGTESKLERMYCTLYCIFIDHEIVKRKGKKEDRRRRWQ